MNNPIDSYRFLDGLTARVLKNWARLEPVRETPWTPLTRPLNQCTVALVSSAALALKHDVPFDLEIERRNPWISDPSYRVLPRGVTEKDVEVCHLHIDPQFARQDLNCIFPLQRLTELEVSEEIDRVAERHYSFMGYTCEARPLLEQSVPGMIRSLQEDRVDVVLLIPV